MIRKYINFLMIFRLAIFTVYACLPFASFSTDIDTVLVRQYKIENQTRTVVSFSIGVDGNDFSTMQGLADAINKMPEEFPGEPAERKAWRFIRKNLEYNIALTDKPWFHAPLRFLNSIGFGICDDLAVFQSHLWRALGYKARVWDIHEHAVPEVFRNGRWQMYDPTFRVYYRTAKGEIAGVEDLVEQPRLITRPYERLPVMDFKRISTLLFKSYRYSGKMVRFYQSSDITVNEWYEKEFNEDMSFTLPPMGSVVFPVNSPDPVHVKNWIGLPRQLSYYMKITLPVGFKGPVRVPFLITSISGAGTVSAGRLTYNLRDQKMIFDLDEIDESTPDTVFVRESSGPIEIYCLVNPALFVSDTLTVSLFGAKAAQLKVTKRDNTPLLNVQELFFLDHNGRSEQGYLQTYDRYQTALEMGMFNEDTLMNSVEDIKTNLEYFFNFINYLDNAEKLRRIEKYYRELKQFYGMAKTEQEQERILRFYSTPLKFITLLYVMEESLEGNPLDLMYDH